MKFAMISINDRGNLGARQLVAQVKALGHEAHLILFGEYDHKNYVWSETLSSPRPPPETESSLTALINVINNIRPEWIGISYRSAMADMALHIARNIRTGMVQRHVQIIAGGIGATSDPEQAATWADLVCVGEGEGTITAICQNWSYADIPNIIRCGQKNQRAPLISDLDSLPFPDYDGLTTWTIVRGRVTHPDGRVDNDIGAYPILTSRGCPRACSYCHNSTVHELYRGEKYSRQRSVANVMAELAWARERFFFKLLSIYDDLFIAQPEWVFKFAQELPKVWPEGRRFWCMAHPAYVREDVIRALVECGLEEICLGVQSGSDRMLKRYRRGSDRSQIWAATDCLAKFPSLAVKIDIISANPDETKDDVAATLDLIQRMPRAANWHIGLSRLTIFPGSAIAEDLTEERCLACHDRQQDFVDGLYRAAFDPKRYGTDLTKALPRFDDYRAWWIKRGELTPTDATLATWLDQGAPKGG